MISLKDIRQFFDLEAESSKKRWEATMKLSVNERVRKRKAIKSVVLDKSYSGVSNENYHLLKVKIDENLSDFKEGECLILHKENTTSGIPCRLYSFEEDNYLILEVFPLDMPSSLEFYHDEKLILDKGTVDLRDHIYAPFLNQLSNKPKEFWSDSIINNPVKPSFSNEEACELHLQETEESFRLELLPKQREAIKKCMLSDDYYMIQGPPGTGKSFVLGIIILEELLDLKRNVIVIGPNHMAINNVMTQALKLLPTYSPFFTKVGQSYNAPTLKLKYSDKDYEIVNVPRLNISRVSRLNSEYNRNWMVGLTPHALYTNRARGLECDTLIIDEAGQMTIPLALMGMIKAKKVILAGDHKQLPPIISSNDVHDELKESIFQRLITSDNCTMLDTSFRMCEPICNFVSELFYDGKLFAMKKGHGNLLICSDPLYSFDSPVVLKEIDDNGEQISERESVWISETVANFIRQGVPACEIAILSPFRAQAANIRRCIRKNKDIADDCKLEITSDTIDKMQGQEREVIIYSMVSGNVDYMIEMAEFLYNPNKMNVAFSRAKSKLIIVGSLNKIANLNLPEYPHIKCMMESTNAVRYKSDNF